MPLIVSPVGMFLLTIGSELLEIPDSAACQNASNSQGNYRSRIARLVLRYPSWTMD